MSNYILKLALLLCLLSPEVGGGEQFVDLTAEIEMTDWSYHFFIDNIPNDGTNSSSFFVKNSIVHCVVGTNAWFMESDHWLRNGKVRYWFTGTNIIEHDEIAKDYTDANGYLHPVGEERVSVDQCLDGNPGRPVRVVDLLDLGQQIPWLAFCSGSVLKTDGRHINPPWAMWKATVNAPHGFSDQSTVFKDDFGLPVSMKLFAESSQTVFQYQVHQTTNVLGWNFPLEFYMVQYEQDVTNGWVVSITARGRITAIGTGIKPQIPQSVLNAVNYPVKR